MVYWSEIVYQIPQELQNIFQIDAINVKVPENKLNYHNALFRDYFLIPGVHLGDNQSGGTMIPRQRLAAGCLLSGVPCIPNGYQFIRQSTLISLGWGLIVAGSALTLLGAYLLFVTPAKPVASGAIKPANVQERNGGGRKKPKKSKGRK